MAALVTRSSPMPASLKALLMFSVRFATDSTLSLVTVSGTPSTCNGIITEPAESLRAAGVAGVVGAAVVGAGVVAAAVVGAAVVAAAVVGAGLGTAVATGEGAAVVAAGLGAAVVDGEGAAVVAAGVGAAVVDGEGAAVVAAGVGAAVVDGEGAAVVAAGLGAAVVAGDGADVAATTCLIILASMSKEAATPLMTACITVELSVGIIDVSLTCNVRLMATSTVPAKATTKEERSKAGPNIAVDAETILSVLRQSNKSS